MMMLASPSSSLPDAVMHADPRVGPGVARFVDDALQRPYRQRLVRLVLQERDPAALVVVAHQPDERRDRAVGARRAGHLIDQRLQIERRCCHRHGRHTAQFSRCASRNDSSGRALARAPARA